MTSKVGSGATPRGGKAVYTNDGPAFIRSQNVLDNAMKLDDVARITDEAARQLKGVTVLEGDVLLNITGDSIARTCVVDPAVLPARVSQHVAIIRTSRELDGRFLQRYLVQTSTKEHLLSISDGGTRKALTKAHIENLLIPVPPIGVQRGIAEVLGALDDKIGANTTALATVESLMLARYELAVARDPSHSRLEAVAQFHNRRRVPLSAQQREVRVGCVPYYGATGVFGYVDEALFDEHLVLVGEDGSVVQPSGQPVVQYVWGPAWVNNHAHVLTGVGMSTETLRLAIQRANVVPIVTGAVQPKISMGNLKSLTLDVPGPQELVTLEPLVSSLSAVVRAKTEESRHLAEMRDALLPQLMSGKIRVKDAERVVEGVV